MADCVEHQEEEDHAGDGQVHVSQRVLELWAALSLSIRVVDLDTEADDDKKGGDAEATEDDQWTWGGRTRFIFTTCNWILIKRGAWQTILKILIIGLQWKYYLIQNSYFM